MPQDNRDFPTYEQFCDLKKLLLSVLEGNANTLPSIADADREACVYEYMSEYFRLEAQFRAEFIEDTLSQQTTYQWIVNQEYFKKAIDSLNLQIVSLYDRKTLEDKYAQRKAYQAIKIIKLSTDQKRLKLLKFKDVDYIKSPIKRGINECAIKLIDTQSNRANKLINLNTMNKSRLRPNPNLIKEDTAIKPFEELVSRLEGLAKQHHGYLWQQEKIIYLISDCLAQFTLSKRGVSITSETDISKAVENAKSSLEEALKKCNILGQYENLIYSGNYFAKEHIQLAIEALSRPRPKYQIQKKHNKNASLQLVLTVVRYFLTNGGIQITKGNKEKLYIAWVGEKGETKHHPIDDNLIRISNLMIRKGLSDDFLKSANDELSRSILKSDMDQLVKTNRDEFLEEKRKEGFLTVDKDERRRPKRTKFRPNSEEIANFLENLLHYQIFQNTKYLDKDEITKIVIEEICKNAIEKKLSQNDRSSLQSIKGNKSQAESLNKSTLIAWVL